eukprot:TRINITY_DN25994_c0_g1_i1.p1 TRINITY_DN25994_c0_g1~~TRINITY_DN25994_c0_g1_i1.p1  ORF type:complete len:240 (+),score=36.98 TRINITY_DN25994_c0_g1_i1:103-720(+)
MQLCALPAELLERVLSWLSVWDCDDCGTPAVAQLAPVCTRWHAALQGEALWEDYRAQGVPACLPQGWTARSACLVGLRMWYWVFHEIPQMFRLWLHKVRCRMGVLSVSFGVYSAREELIVWGELADSASGTVSHVVQRYNRQVYASSPFDRAKLLANRKGVLKNPCFWVRKLLEPLQPGALAPYSGPAPVPLPRDDSDSSDGAPW